jgi:integrase/recombinase XerD
MKQVGLYGRVRHAVSIEGISQREAARVFGIDPRTVAKIEIAALRVGDVFDESGGVKDTFYLSADQTKGSDSGSVLVNTKLQRQLAKFAKQYPVHTSNRSAPLLFSAKGGGFTAQTIVNLFKRLYKLAGIDGASSHSGRRQFVTQLADRGINARLVQVLARHKHLSTTQRYIDVNENALRNAVELLNFKNWRQKRRALNRQWVQKLYHQKPIQYLFLLLDFPG